MEEYRNEAHKFLSNLSDEEFFGLLEDAGFNLEPGEGKVIFTEEEVSTPNKMIKHISYDYHSGMEIKTNSILENIKIKKEKTHTGLKFKSMKSSFNIEGYGVA